jgi:thymidylate kinase
MLRKLPKAGRSSTREKMLEDPRVSKSWLFFAIVDLVFLYTFIRIKSIFGSVVVCDRYIQDTKLDFLINFPAVNFEKFLVWRFLELVKPKPDIAFLLMVSPELSISRGLEKDEPFPDDLATLKKRHELYSDSTLFPSKEFNFIDCSDSKLKVSQEIMNLVKSKLKINR